MIEYLGGSNAKHVPFQDYMRKVIHRSDEPNVTLSDQQMNVFGVWQSDFCGRIWPVLPRPKVLKPSFCGSTLNFVVSTPNYYKWRPTPSSCDEICIVRYWSMPCNVDFFKLGDSPGKDHCAPTSPHSAAMRPGARLFDWVNGWSRPRGCELHHRIMETSPLGQGGS